MPKRTNLFQEVVEILHRHMAGDATVEASAMLPSQSTGALREVDVVIRAKQANFTELIEQIDLANRTEDSVERFTFVVGPTEGDEIQLEVNGVPKTLFLLNENGVGYSLRRIRAVGKGEIKVSKIPLTHGRLGDWNVNFGYGEGKVGGRDALLVVSERDEGEGLLTMRIRPLDAGNAA